MDLAFPSRLTPLRPPESCAAPARPSWGFFPFSDKGSEVHWPGVPYPVRSACRVFHPLDDLLPHLLSDLEGRYRSWGLGPPEPYPSAEPYASRRLNPHVVSDIACSCSEDQEVTMPRNSRALLSAEIRTCGKPGSATADALMGFSPFRSLLHGSEAKPVARSLPFAPKETELDEPEPPWELGDFHDPRMTWFRRTRSGFIRASTRTCPRVLPKTWCPDRKSDPKVRGRRSTEPGSEDQGHRYSRRSTFGVPRGALPAEPLEELPLPATFSSHHVVKEKPSSGQFREVRFRVL